MKRLRTQNRIERERKLTYLERIRDESLNHIKALPMPEPTRSLPYKADQVVEQTQLSDGTQLQVVISPEEGPILQAPAQNGGLYVYTGGYNMSQDDLTELMYDIREGRHPMDMTEWSYIDPQEWADIQENGPDPAAGNYQAAQQHYQNAYDLVSQAIQEIQMAQQADPRNKDYIDAYTIPKLQSLLTGNGSYDYGSLGSYIKSVRSHDRKMLMAGDPIPGGTVVDSAVAHGSTAIIAQMDDGSWAQGFEDYEYGNGVEVSPCTEEQARAWLAGIEREMQQDRDNYLRDEADASYNYQMSHRYMSYDPKRTARSKTQPTSRRYTYQRQRKQMDASGYAESSGDIAGAAYLELEAAYSQLCQPGSPSFEYTYQNDPSLIQNLAQAFNQIFITLWPNA